MSMEELGLHCDSIGSLVGAGDAVSAASALLSSVSSGYENVGVVRL